MPVIQFYPGSLSDKALWQFRDLNDRFIQSRAPRLYGFLRDSIDADAERRAKLKEGEAVEVSMPEVELDQWDTVSLSQALTVMMNVSFGSAFEEDVANAVDRFVIPFTNYAANRMLHLAVDLSVARNRIKELEGALTAALSGKAQSVALKKENLELKSRVRELEAK